MRILPAVSNIIGRQLQRSRRNVITMATSNTGERRSIMTYSPSSSCQYEISDDKATFAVRHPGWSINELNMLSCLLHEPFYLRVWRVTQFLDLVSETGKKLGFLDIINFEETHLTYFKCLDIDRVASLGELEELGCLPYHYGLTVNHWLSRVGNTSFQVNGEVKATESGKSLFRYSTVCVSVDKKTRKVTENPKWWAEKYREAATKRSAKPLRTNLKREYSADDLISRSSMTVQALDLDYYGHVNNSGYIAFATNAVLSAQLTNKLPWTIKEVENSIHRMECDFISDCGLGDELVMSVYRDAGDVNTLYVTLCKGDAVIYVQMLQYDSAAGDASKL